jgi:hypothetical protein
VTAPARPWSDMDVPLAAVERAVVVASLDPFARMACEHPEACSCPADYPQWAAALAAQPTYRHPQEKR